MAATLIHNTTSNFTRNLIGALFQAKALGLTEALIAAITSTGTIAKLRTVFTTLQAVAHETDQFRWDKIIAILDQAEDQSVIVNANVETARAAGSGVKFAALCTAIVARADGIVSTPAPSDFQII